eukprot:897094-Rhodomonas_salina.1
MQGSVDRPMWHPWFSGQLSQSVNPQCALAHCQLYPHLVVWAVDSPQKSTTNNTAVSWHALMM